MIGIICNYYIRNYGSVLQSLALQYEIDRLTNFESEIIQFEQRFDKKDRIKILIKLQLSQLFSPQKVALKLKSLLSRNDSLYNTVLKDRDEVFQNYVEEHFRFSEKYDSIIDIQNGLSRYNKIVLGSDQLWCPTDLLLGYHTLEWVPSNYYKASYGTSFGVEKPPGFCEKIIKECIPRLNRVSVREEAGKSIINNLCGISVPTVADPTLLLSRKEWDDICGTCGNEYGNYIFCYFLSNNYQLKKWANELKEQTNLKIITIPHLESFDENANSFGDVKVWKADPSKLISLIKHATYVLSDSFHVSVFSIIYNKQFLVFDRYQRTSRDSRNNRIDNLLNNLDLIQRNYCGNGKIVQQIENNIDYNSIESRVEQMREKSISYLKTVIKEDINNGIMDEESGL